ncbi:DUF4349 domain-containing protein [Phenylobacterium sp.]|uniref:DUF4349 domain-containing protein n=1 Tax=Phenylobacterium sp. TaxID=1871053 RepID=UPI00286C7C86|nr:DUF4349 domain-containing protein [Phenylobacterium sp.]
MRSKTLPAVTLMFLLGACGQAAERKQYAGGEAVAADAAAAAPAQAPQAKVPAGVPMLAYSYDYGLTAPPKAIRALLARHEAACAKAGPAVCQVTGSSVTEEGPDRVVGQLSMRATPAWLTRFRTGLAGEAKDAGGRLVRASVASEDLSREIVDTEAMLRAKTTLRDRLQGLLASRPGKLADLVELERELARVQGELDSAQSQLAVMRQRVATSEIEVGYESAGVLAPQGVWAPLAAAFGDFVAILAVTLAGMVRFVAWTTPWLILLAGMAWLFRRRLTGLFRRKTPKPPQA